MQPAEPEVIEVRPSSTARLQEHYGFNNHIDASPFDVAPGERSRINMATRGRVIE